jgi:hypothetical protein
VLLVLLPCPAVVGVRHTHNSKRVYYSLSTVVKSGAMAQLRSYMTVHQVPVALWDDLDDQARLVYLLDAAGGTLGQHGWAPACWRSVEADYQRLIGDDWVTCERPVADVVRARVEWAIETADGKRGAWGEAWD